MYKQICSTDAVLYDYQQEAKSKIFSSWDICNDVMMQMPTGTGKTMLFSSIIRDVFDWIRKTRNFCKILIIVHRRELIDQASEKLSKVYGVAHGCIGGGYEKNLSYQVQVASIQTLTHPSNQTISKSLDAGFIIIDEAHHSMAPSYRKLWEWYPKAKKLGVTATPWRMNHSGFAGLFQKLIMSHSVKEFINMKRLSTFTYYSIKKDSFIQKAINGLSVNSFGEYKEEELDEVMDKSAIRAQLLSSYQKYANGKKGIIYSISREHSKHICEEFKAAGISIDFIDSKTSKQDRQDIIRNFKGGKLDIIVNVDIFSEGFDCPDIEFIQLARPTQSLVKYLQQVGRGLRTHKNKENCIILDNVGMHTRFGLPDANRHWLAHFKGINVDEAPKFIDSSSTEKHSRDTNLDEGNEEMVLIQDGSVREVPKNKSERKEPKKNKIKGVAIERKGKRGKRIKEYYINEDNCCRVFNSEGETLFKGNGYLEEFLGEMYNIQVFDNKTFKVEKLWKLNILLSKKVYGEDYGRFQVIKAKAGSPLAEIVHEHGLDSIMLIEKSATCHVITVFDGINNRTFDKEGKEIQTINLTTDDEMELVNDQDAESVIEEQEDLILNDTTNFANTFGFKTNGSLLCLNHKLHSLFEIYLNVNGTYVIDQLIIDREKLSEALVKENDTDSSQEASKIHPYFDAYWNSHTAKVVEAPEGTPLFDLLEFGSVSDIKNIDNYGGDSTIITVCVKSDKGRAKHRFFDFSGTELSPATARKLKMSFEASAVNNKEHIMDNERICPSYVVNLFGKKLGSMFIVCNQGNEGYGFKNSAVVNSNSRLAILLKKKYSLRTIKRISKSSIVVENIAKGRIEKYNRHGVLLQMSDGSYRDRTDEKVIRQSKRFEKELLQKLVENCPHEKYDYIMSLRDTEYDEELLRVVQFEVSQKRKEAILTAITNMNEERHFQKYVLTFYKHFDYYILKPACDEANLLNSVSISAKSALGIKLPHCLNNDSFDVFINEETIVLRNVKNQTDMVFTRFGNTYCEDVEQNNIRDIYYVQDFCRSLETITNNKEKQQALVINEYRDKRLDAGIDIDISIRTKPAEANNSNNTASQQTDVIRIERQHNKWYFTCNDKQLGFSSKDFDKVLKNIQFKKMRALYLCRHEGKLFATYKEIFPYLYEVCTIGKDALVVHKEDHEAYKYSLFKPVGYSNVTEKYYVHISEDYGYYRLYTSRFSYALYDSNLMFVNSYSDFNYKGTGFYHAGRRIRIKK